MPSTRAKARTFPVDKVSNEILLVILSNLDPPSAVCFALSNKQLYTFVASFCKRGIDDVCPKTIKNFRRAPVLLQKYEPTKTETKFYFSLRNCFRIQYDESAFLRYDGSVRLTKQYISLMLRLRNSSFLDPQAAPCLQAGHLKTVFEASTACVICADIAKPQLEWDRADHDPEKVRSLSKILHQQADGREEDVAAWDRSFFESKPVETAPKPRRSAQQHSTPVKKGALAQSRRVAIATGSTRPVHSLLYGFGDESEEE